MVKPLDVDTVIIGDRTYTLRRDEHDLRWRVDGLPPSEWRGDREACERMLRRIVATGEIEALADRTPTVIRPTCDRCHERPPVVGSPGQPLLCAECAETMDPTQDPERRRAIERSKSTPQVTPQVTREVTPQVTREVTIADRLEGVPVWMEIPHGRGKAFTPEVIAACVELLDAGHRVSDIVRALGCSDAGLRYQLDKAGWRPKQPRRSSKINDPGDPAKLLAEARARIAELTAEVEAWESVAADVLPDADLDLPPAEQAEALARWCEQAATDRARLTEQLRSPVRVQEIAALVVEGIVVSVRRA